MEIKIMRGIKTQIHFYFKIKAPLGAYELFLIGQEIPYPAEQMFWQGDFPLYYI